ncbi:hypothetical protein FRC17_008866 [Serendipita sp. 399]|nr:hypothetical protein FRC17_008866 [Serendipita sp. 399]
MDASSATTTAVVEKSLPLSEHNLSTEEVIHAYLNQHTPFPASSVTRLSGGFANWTYRATLRDPYEFTNTRNQRKVVKSIVVKFSSDVAAAFGTVALDLYRTKAEVAAIKLVSGLDLPGMRLSKADADHDDEAGARPTVSLPELLLYDSTNHVGCYVDLGPLSTLKDYLKSHPSNPEAIQLATDAGHSLGEFLAGLHLWGWKLLQTEHSPTSTSTTPPLDVFYRNGAWQTIGVLEGVIKEFSSSSIEGEADWEKITNVMRREVLEVNETFNHGDFWTGNVLIEIQTPPIGSRTETRTLKALHLLDWETAKTGSASTDIAQFAAEAFMLRQFSASPAGEALLISFLTAYEDYIRKKGSSETMEKVKDDVGTAAKPSALSGSSDDSTTTTTTPNGMLDSRSVLARLCTHVVTIGKMVSWADKETTDITTRMMLQVLIENDQRSTTKSLKDVLTLLGVVEQARDQ